MSEAAARVAALQEAQREINQLRAESAAPPSEQEQVWCSPPLERWHLQHNLSGNVLHFLCRRHSWPLSVVPMQMFSQLLRSFKMPSVMFRMLRHCSRNGAQQ